MRRQVVTTITTCDLCLHGISRCILCGREPDMSAGSLDFCARHRDKARPCESCGSLPTFPDPQATWAGNCLVCWRAALELPRGKCSALGASLTWRVDGHGHSWHFCDQLAHHRDAHHCPACGENWGQP